MVHTTSYRAGTHRGSRKGSASGIWGKLCAIFGLIAVLAGLLTVVRAVAPEKVPPIKAFSVQQCMITTIVLAVVTLVFVVIARVRAHSVQRHTLSTVWGILAIVLSLMLTGCGWAVNVIFPEGAVKPEVRDEAPITNAAAMQQGVESAYGSCPDGWKSHDTSEYPGVASIQLCVQTRTAYATFSNTSALGLYKAPLESKALELLNEHSGEAGQSEWATLSGKQWVVVGKKDGAQKLQKSWGGTVEDLSTIRQ